MKLFHTITLVLCFIILAVNCYAKEVVVGLEPFPPLIKSTTEGYTVSMLKEIEKVSDLTFKIKIMPYSRAKINLKRKQIDLMGHTPYKQENQVFYTYAQELNWSIDSKSDLYATNKANLKPENIGKESLGVPYGNKEFHSEITGIPIEKFKEGHLENLLKMLVLGRIDAFTFERASTMSTIKKLKIPNVYYKQFPSIIIPSSLAVRNDQKGNQLKKRLDNLIQQVDQQQIFKDYFTFINLPDSGIVQLQ